MINFNPNVQKLVLSRFSGVYGEPKVPNVEALCEEYHKALKGFSDDALTFGADKAIAENVYPNWPTIGECVKFCREYRPPRTFVRSHDFGVVEGEPSDPAELAAMGERVAALAAEFKASVQSRTINSDERSKRPAPDRNYFNARGWADGKKISAPKGDL